VRGDDDVGMTAPSRVIQISKNEAHICNAELKKRVRHHGDTVISRTYGGYSGCDKG